MMKKVMALIAFTFACNLLWAKPIIVGVIDTGINPSLKEANLMCDKGHKDFSNAFADDDDNSFLNDDSSSIDDDHGHGSNISGIIDQYAKGIVFSSTDTIEERIAKVKKLKSTKIDYCQLIIKYYSPRNTAGNMQALIEAFKYAVEQHVDIINYSGGGALFDAKEQAVVKDALDKGIVIVVAAGNEGEKLGAYYYRTVSAHHSVRRRYTYYPAMDDPRVIVVGNYTENGEPNVSSNFGPLVTAWEIGTNVISYSKRDGFLSSMTGSSQSTATKTGKLVRAMLLKNK